jgi:hypothetical protein
MKEAQVLLQEALHREAQAQRLILSGEAEEASAPLREAADLYRRSWEKAPPRAYGRLAGMLKAAILAGGGAEEAAYVRDQVADDDSPASAWVLGLAALAAGDVEAARRAAIRMHEGDDAFRRSAEAVDALAAGDEGRYAEAVAAIVRDFESRDEHLTSVPIADTALVLERLAEARGLAARPSSTLLPQR